MNFTLRLWPVKPTHGFFSGFALALPPEASAPPPGVFLALSLVGGASEERAGEGRNKGEGREG
jgi:hypothetical protein